MAGALTISTLNNDTGVLATQNGMTGIAKAWVRFAGSNGAIAASFNVSSITRFSTGRYTINFTTSMPNANYAISSTASFQTGVTNAVFCSVDTDTLPATGSCRVASQNNSGTYVDAAIVYAAILSS
jgi:hypothetical protein